MENLRRKLFRRAFLLSLAVGVLAIVFVGSALMLFFEKRANPEIRTYWDAVWLQFVTMATVGYGDIVPATIGGRITAILSMVFGVALLSTYISVRAGLRVQKIQRRRKGLERTTRNRDHFVVCGWNARGDSLLSGLKGQVEKDKVPILLLCDLEERPVEDPYFFFLKGNPTSEAALKRANIERACGAILLADETHGGDKGDIDARTVLTALTVKSLNPDLQMTAEVLESENIDYLLKAGVVEILDLNTLAGSIMARSAVNFGLIGIIADMVGADQGQRVFRIPVEKGQGGLKYSDILAGLGKDYEYTFLAVQSEGRIRKKDENETASPGETILIMSRAEPPGVR